MLLESNNCRYCGVNTKSEEGWVNRLSHGMDKIDCYACGPCQDTLDAISDDEGRSDYEFDTVYIPERIKEIDAKYPDAILFRTIVQLCEQQGFEPFTVGV